MLAHHANYRNGIPDMEGPLISSRSTSASNPTRPPLKTNEWKKMLSGTFDLQIFL